MSEDTPTFSILLNGTEAKDFFTTFETRRYVRNQIGSFKVSLDDYQFAQWGDLAKWMPVIFAINGTRIFKGRIDTIVRHYDKEKDGYLTTVSGRDDAAALMDILMSRYYYRKTPAVILADLINVVYPSRKGTLDPALSLGSTVNFHGLPGDVYTHNWDRVSFWQAVNELCSDVEGQYASTPLFLDYLVDENDKVFVTQTGELATGIDIGGYGGDYIKVSDWTVDALPIKNEIWFCGDSKAGVLPLEMDSWWDIVHGVPASDPWTEGTASYYHQLVGPGWSVTTPPIPVDDGNKAFSPGVKSIKIPFDGSGISLSGPPFFGWTMPMPFGPNTSDFQIFRRGPNGHLNFYNNDVMDESMGQISGLNFALAAANTFDMFLLFIDGQQPTPAVVSTDRVHYSPTFGAAGTDPWWYNPNIGVESGIVAPFWHILNFPVPLGNSGVLETEKVVGVPTPAFFDWSDVAQINFIIIPPLALGIGHYSVDIWFDDLTFIKPLVAQSTPAPLDSIHSEVVTDTSVTDYQIAVNRANNYRVSTQQAQSYIDYQIFGRPDLQVGHTFDADGETLLIRESITNVSKDAGYGVKVKAWKALP